ncbi:MAG: hypothetical protein K6B74_10630 [Ruminococcus sp.]|nr:hypothetical protein [Ruminococcus sp.]
MKKEQFYEAMGDIDDRLVNEASRSAQVKPKTWRYFAAAAACLVVCAGAGAALNHIYNGRNTVPVENESSAASGTSAQPAAGANTSAPTTQQTETINIEPPASAKKCKVLAEAVYPELPPYPEMPTEGTEEEWEKFTALQEEWWNANKVLSEQPEGFDKGMDEFFRNSVGTLMTEQDGTNKVYSPASLYMALGMSAEITDGNSRGQILGLLGQDSIEEMRSHAKSVWQSVYKKDNTATCVLADSLWMNSMFPCKQSTADSLAENYYASIFTGDPAAEEYTQMFRGWIDGQTDGLLGDYTKELKLDPDMVMTLASTVNYSGKWLEKFQKENTSAETFHAPSGDREAQFMHADRQTAYWSGGNFGAISMSLENNGEMRLILPDEGFSAEELFTDGDALNFMTSWNDYENGEYSIVHMSVPKFDVSAHINLSTELKKLGVTDIFDSSISDFTPLTEDIGGIFISQAEQDSRVMIDEEGCRAAAVTIMGGMGAGAPDNEVDFVLDRPFVFEIVGGNGIPLFVGVVNVPE